MKALRKPRLSTELPAPEQKLVARWEELIGEAEGSGLLKTAQPEAGVVMFAWYYDKYGVHELGPSASDPQVLLEYQPKLRMRERKADGERKETMRGMASDYFFKFRMYRLETGVDHTRAHPRYYTTWDLPIELKKWIYFEIVKCYVYIDRQRMIKRLIDRLAESGYSIRTPVQKIQRTNRIKARGPDGATISANVTQAIQSVGFEGLGFEEAVALEVKRAGGGQVPPIEEDVVEMRRAIEGDEYAENEGLWEEHGPPALRRKYFDLIKKAHSSGERQVADEGKAVLFAYPLKGGGASEKRKAFYDAIGYVRERHRSQLRGRFYQFAPSREPPEDLYITHVVNEWVSDAEAGALIRDGKVHTVQWVDGRAVAGDVLEGFSRIGIQSSTGKRTAQMRQRVLLRAGPDKKPFELAYSAQLIALHGYDFNQAVDLGIIKAFLKVEGA